MTTSTLEPDSEMVISVKVKKNESTIRIAGNSSLNFSFLVLLNIKEPSINKVSFVITMSIPKTHIKKMISIGVEKNKSITEIAENSSFNSSNKSESGLKQNTQIIIPHISSYMVAQSITMSIIA